VSQQQTTTPEIKQQPSAERLSVDIDRYAQALWGPPEVETERAAFAESFAVESEPTVMEWASASPELPWD
jgi:hypothetical protein